MQLLIDLSSLTHWTRSTASRSTQIWASTGSGLLGRTGSGFHRLTRTSAGQSFQSECLLHAPGKTTGIYMQNFISHTWRDRGRLKWGTRVSWQPLLVIKCWSEPNKRSESSSVFPTSIAVRLHAISVLQPVTPGALVPGRSVLALADSVAALEPVGPLAPVNPPPLGFHAEPVSFPLRPVALIQVPTGPGVDADYLEATGPRAGVLALAFGSGAHTVAVGFAVLPASTVGATIVKVETTTRHPGTEGKK